MAWFVGVGIAIGVAIAIAIGSELKGTEMRDGGSCSILDCPTATPIAIATPTGRLAGTAGAFRVVRPKAGGLAVTNGIQSGDQAGSKISVSPDQTFRNALVGQRSFPSAGSSTSRTSDATKPRITTK